MTRGWVLAALAAAAAAVVYALTMHPTVAGGDSAELTTAAVTLGIAHPSGYPLFMLLGQAFFRLVPFGDPAFRVNLVSVVAAAAAAGLVCLTAWNRTRNLAAALAAWGLYAFSALAWENALRAEVIGLNAAFVAALFCLLERYLAKADRRWVLAGAFVSGLALCNHHAVALVAVPAALTVAQNERDGQRRLELFAAAAALFLAGLLPYLYLPWAYSRHPAMTWGELNGVGGVLVHALRLEFGVLTMYPLYGQQYVDPLGRLALFGAVAARATLWVGLPFAALGALAARAPRGKPDFEAAVLLSLALYVLLFALKANLDLGNPLERAIELRLWLQPSICLVLLMATGLAAVLRLEGRLPTAIAAMSALALAVAQLALNWRASDHHRDRLVRRLAEAALDSAAPNAVILSQSEVPGDVMRYLVLAERRRPDVRVLPLYFFRFHWGETALREAMPALEPVWQGGGGLNLEAWPPQVPLYASGPLSTLPGLLAQKLGQTSVALPFGLLTRIERRDRLAGIDWQAWTGAGGRALESLRDFPAVPEGLDAWGGLAVLDYGAARADWMRFKAP